MYIYNYIYIHTIKNTYIYIYIYVIYTYTRGTCPQLSTPPAAFSLGSLKVFSRRAPEQGQDQFQVQHVEKTHQKDYPSHGQQHLVLLNLSGSGENFSGFDVQKGIIEIKRSFKHWMKCVGCFYLCVCVFFSFFPSNASIEAWLSWGIGLPYQFTMWIQAQIQELDTLKSYSAIPCHSWSKIHKASTKKSWFKAI